MPSGKVTSPAPTFSVDTNAATAAFVTVALTTRERTFKRALLDQARIEPAHQVLDVGCGTGTLAIAAQRRQPGARMSGLDADPAVLAIAARKARLAQFGVS